MTQASYIDGNEAVLKKYSGDRKVGPINTFFCITEFNYSDNRYWFITEI